MKINRIKCEQFAGLLDKDVEFTDGMNLIIGDNETGNSTLVDLLHSVLFQDAKLNNRSDADFISKYFPKNTGDVQGVEIDGTVEFETESGKYKLSKEWGLNDYSCKLKLPNGVAVRGQETINEILANELVHRKDIYEQIVFASQKREHIYSAFMEMMESVEGNPVDEIEKKFREYLAVITDETLQVADMDEKLFVELESGSHALTYDILSDGTKDTISLAFRLAMLEHLFPNGNGLAVFDDPFTDMDPTRVQRACDLLNKFAEKNQVIFVTCDGKYKNLFSGSNVIPA